MKRLINLLMGICALVLLGACTTVAVTSTNNDEPLSMDTAVRFALSRRPHLQGKMAKLQRPQDTVELTANVRKAWINTVASGQTVRYLAEVKETAQVSALVLNVQLAKAEQAAQAHKEKLASLMGLAGTSIGFTLPERLPDLPPALQPLAEKEAQAMREPSDAASVSDITTRQAFGVYEATYKLALFYQQALCNGTSVNKATKVSKNTQESCFSRQLKAHEAVLEFHLAEIELQKILAARSRFDIDS